MLRGNLSRGLTLYILIPLKDASADIHFKKITTKHRNREIRRGCPQRRLAYAFSLPCEIAPPVRPPPREARSGWVPRSRARSTSRRISSSASCAPVARADSEGRAPDQQGQRVTSMFLITVGDVILKKQSKSGTKTIGDRVPGALPTSSPSCSTSPRAFPLRLPARSRSSRWHRLPSLTCFRVTRSSRAASSAYSASRLVSASPRFPASSAVPSCTPLTPPGRTTAPPPSPSFRHRSTDRPPRSPASSHWPSRRRWCCTATCRCRWRRTRSPTARCTTPSYSSSRPTSALKPSSSASPIGAPSPCGTSSRCTNRKARMARHWAAQRVAAAVSVSVAVAASGASSSASCNAAPSP